MSKFYFDNWNSIPRTTAISFCAFPALLIVLPISGKQTLAKVNAFVFVVTIAIGSTLTTVILNKNVALAEGLLALFLLIFFQRLITWLSARSRQVSSLVKFTPSLLVYTGGMMKGMMLKDRIDEDEILATVPQNGLSFISQAEAIIFATNGSLTLIKQVLPEGADALHPIKKPGPEKEIK